MTIASLLKKKQKSLDLSTYALAKKLRIGFASVQRTLDGSSKPNARTIARYAKFLGVSAEKIGGGPGRGRGAAKRKGAGRGKR